MTLGQKLRQTRLSKGLSQSQVAGGCVTRNMLSQIENDQASPSMRTLEHLARALDVSVGWLLSDEQTDAALEKMRRARTLFREEDYAGCLALFAQDAPSGDEMLLLCSQAAGMLAAQRLAAENFSGAKELAQQALDWNRKESVCKRAGAGAGARCAGALCDSGKAGGRGGRALPDVLSGTTERGAVSFYDGAVSSAAGAYSGGRARDLVDCGAAGRAACRISDSARQNRG